MKPAWRPLWWPGHYIELLLFQNCCILVECVFILSTMNYCQVCGLPLLVVGVSCYHSVVKLHQPSEKSVASDAVADLLRYSRHLVCCVFVWYLFTRNSSTVWDGILTTLPSLSRLSHRAGCGWPAHPMNQSFMSIIWRSLCQMVTQTVICLIVIFWSDVLF